MSPAIPETETMKISDIKAKLSSLVNEVCRHKRRILIEKSGLPTAALISPEDFVRYQRYEREWADRFTVDQLQEALKDVLSEGQQREVVAIIRKMRVENVEREERWRVLDAMRAPFLNVPVEEIEREVAKAIAEVRAERRAEREAASRGLSSLGDVESRSSSEDR